MRIGGRHLRIILAAVALAACTPPVDFQHGLNTATMPMTHSEFDADTDKFTFAVFSDLTGGEREGIFEVAVAQLNLLRPEFIMGVGDLIEGGTEDRSRLDTEWDSFDRRADAAIAPLFYVGGNHDLTNVVMRDVWKQRYGARYYHFVYKRVLFLVLDTEDNTPERMQEIHLARSRALERVRVEGWEVLSDTEYGRAPERKTGTIGAEQSQYFQSVIERNPNVRWTFVFLHKPAWEKEGEENFAAIESALQNSPYTVFHGHVHAYRHLQRNGRDYIRLGTTGGVQFADRSGSLDHVTLVTVDNTGVDIANLRLSGIFDKTGVLPVGGDQYCFSPAECEQ